MSALIPTELSAHVSNQLRTSVNIEASYEPSRNIACIEHELDEDEVIQAEAFLTWVYENNKSFGLGNINSVYDEFVSKGQPIYDRVISEYNGHY